MLHIHSEQTTVCLVGRQQQNRRGEKQGFVKKKKKKKKKSTVDHIFVLNAIVQKHLEKSGAKMYVAFVDFRKAFEPVRHCKLLETLQKVYPASLQGP